MSPFQRWLQRQRDKSVFKLAVLLSGVLGSLHLRRLSLLIGRRLLVRHQLFDAEFYRAQNRDVAASGWDPLDHYLLHGDREGRWPMPLFDPEFYAHQAKLIDRPYVNRLLHYGRIGRHKRFSPSPWFDTRYYLAHNKDVARAVIDPLRHFMQFGGKEGRSPSPLFDCAHYLRRYADVRESGENPLLHYLRVGQYENRSPLPRSPEHELPQAQMPAEIEWQCIPTPHQGSKPKVDVIVPVYRNAALVLRCLLSVLRSQTKIPYELIVIDDCSPEPALVEALGSLAERGYFTLLKNDSNLGFVQTVNRGMTLHGDRDVILLNADAEVYGDWLDRLGAVVQENDHVGTVTPLSNNATICSYPNFCQDNPFPLEIDYETLDELARERNRGLTIEAPTAVGFCMYISRQCLSEVGLFDADTFGRGYGEENDFCQRAIKKGWRNLIAANTFVRHWGSASFQGERVKLIQNALANLHRLHPNYRKDVQDFIARDPMRQARRELDAGRLLRLRHARNVLLIAHNRGGGTERHLAEEIARLRTNGFGVFVARPNDDGTAVHLSHPDIDALPNLGAFDLQAQGGLCDALRLIGIDEVHVHQLVDYHFDAPKWLAKMVETLGTNLRIVVHDYASICPRINLVDHSGLYCGEPAEAACNACLSRGEPVAPGISITSWRDGYRTLFARSHEIVVPDRDVAIRLARYFPDAPIRVRAHEQDVGFRPTDALPSLLPHEKLRIVVVGAISRIKGYDVVLACARDIQARRLPIELIVFGYTLNDARLEREGVRITGRYLDECADESLAALQPHAVWLPYVWPETYSYTLSIALRARVPVFAFDIGAIASRLRSTAGGGNLLPLNLATRPAYINDRFMSHRASILDRIRTATDEMTA